MAVAATCCFFKFFLSQYHPWNQTISNGKYTQYLIENKHPIPKIIITPPDNTSTTRKEKNSESNEKDEIWIELEDMSSQKKKKKRKKPTDKSCDLTPKTKKNHCNKKAKNENGELTIQMYSNL